MASLLEKMIALGASEEEARRMKRWDRVKYIGKFADNDFHRDPKDNQQSLNRDFIGRVEILFNDQCEKLVNTERNTYLPVSNGIRIDNRYQRSNLGELRRPAFETESVHPSSVISDYYDSPEGLRSSRGL